VTIFLTTHNLAEAEKLCTQVGVISHGKLLALGSPADLRSRTAAPRLYITGQGITEALIDSLRSLPLVKKIQQRNGELVLDLNDVTRSHEIATRLVQAGVKLDEIRKEKADLEEIFLQLVDEEKRGAE
jgi:ABC-2 type transport system ATP-binding protein